MKRLVAVILFGLGCAAGAALSEAGLPEPEMMIHRVHRFRPTHSLRVQPSAAPKNVSRIGGFHQTHSLRPGTR